MEKYQSISKSSFQTVLKFLENEFGEDISKLIDSPQKLVSLFESHFKHQNNLDALFKMVQLVTPNSLGILGYLMLHSSNLYEAINKLIRYHPILGKSLVITLKENENSAQLEIKKKNLTAPIIELIHLLSINMLIESVSSKTSLLESITIVEDVEKYKEELQNRLDCKVVLADSFSLNFSQKTLQEKIPLDNPYILNIFEEEAKKILATTYEKTFTDLVAKNILQSLNALELSKEKIAKSLGVHSKTMEEKLKNEGTTYSLVLTDVRKKLALYYLKKELDVETIAISLGYSSSSGFLRGFKSWFGKSVIKWKEENEAT